MSTLCVPGWKWVRLKWPIRMPWCGQELLTYYSSCLLLLFDKIGRTTTAILAALVSHQPSYVVMASIQPSLLCHSFWWGRRRILSIPVSYSLKKNSTQHGCSFSYTSPCIIILYSIYFFSSYLKGLGTSYCKWGWIERYLRDIPLCTTLKISFYIYNR